MGRCLSSGKGYCGTPCPWGALGRDAHISGQRPTYPVGYLWEKDVHSGGKLGGNALLTVCPPTGHSYGGAASPLWETWLRGGCPSLGGWLRGDAPLVCDRVANPRAFLGGKPAGASVELPTPAARLAGRGEGRTDLPIPGVGGVGGLFCGGEPPHPGPGRAVRGGGAAAGGALSAPPCVAAGGGRAVA